jgi:pimeloyl-ACP methyl ester carboxylesterase
LLHPFTGSALIWGYQQPVFARAGYRVIAFSRRGHARSELGDPAAPGHVVTDIAAVMDHLKIDKCHLVGTAGGGFVVPDFALEHPDRLLSITITCSQGGVTEPAYRASISRLTPQGFAQMPQSFRELGPSYRLANARGMAEWEALEHASLSGTQAVRAPLKNRLHFEDLGRIRAPALVLIGASDMYAPPPLMLQIARHIPGAEAAILSECGHSGYWEQYRAFNPAVLDFVGRHPRRA